VVDAGVAVASGGVGDAAGLTLGVGAAVGDAGRDVGVGAVSSPPQAAAIRAATARQTVSKAPGNLTLIANLH
jgi:hypothetical protein